MNYPSLETIPHEWKPGDVILDLYEVRSVTEGHLDDQIEKPFHEGGFGRVYKVWHRSWRRHLAVKCPKPTVSISQDARSAFQHECETWINLSLHPNVTACHYIRDLGGSPRVFSEYADAGTLAEWIASGRLYRGDDRTTVETILDLSIQFSRGLHHAHESGVIHQDVKSLNALMWEDGSLKVTDFGIGGTRFPAVEKGITHLAQTLMVTAGSMTPSHCSPEQRAGRKLDRRTDVWSWAVCVLEMFNGGVTWLSGTAADKALEAYLEYGSEMKRIPRLPDAMIPLLRKCLSIEPEERPKTLAECAMAVQKVYKENIRLDYARLEPIAVIDSPESLNNRAISLIDLGLTEKAKSFFEQATKKDPSSRPIAYNYNLFKWRTKLIATNEFLKCLDGSITSPSDEDAGSGIEEALIGYELGFFREAISSLQEKSTTNEIAKSVCRQLGNLLHVADNTSTLRFSTRNFDKIVDMQFSWAEGNIFLLGEKVFGLNFLDGSSHEIATSGNKVTWIKALKKSRCLIAWGSSSLSSSKLIIWNSDTESARDVIEVKGKVVRVFETKSPRFLIAYIAYSDPSLLFSKPHSIIQTIDLESCNITKEVLNDPYGAMLDTVSEEGDIIVASLPIAYSNHSPLRILVWNGIDGRVLMDFKYETGVNTFSAIVDQKTMRMFCSTANDPGISVIDLNNGVELAVVAKEIGMVCDLEIAKDGELLLVKSLIDIDGIRLGQVSLFNMQSYALVAVLMRGEHVDSNHFFRWSAFPAKGFVAVGEIATGELTIFRDLAFNRSPYIYLDNKSYIASHDLTTKYTRLYLAADEHWKIGNRDEALKALREARSFPGYSQEQNGKRLWREIGAFCPKIGVRLVSQISVYQPAREFLYDSFYGQGLLHPQGQEVFLVSNGLSSGGEEGQTGSISRGLLWDASTGKTRILLDGIGKCNKTDRFSICKIGSNYIALKGHIKPQFDTMCKFSDISIIEPDCAGYKCDWSKQSRESREMAVSHDGVWIAFTDATLKANVYPSVSLWNTSTKGRVEVELDVLTTGDSEVRFCSYRGFVSLLLSCNLGIHVCSVGNQFQRLLIGGGDVYSHVTVSKCGRFIAAVSKAGQQQKCSIVKVFDIENDGDLKVSMELEPYAGWICLTESADILINRLDRVLQFYSVFHRRLVYQMPIQTDWCTKISNLSRDESKFCIIGRSSIGLYEIDWGH